MSKPKPFCNLRTTPKAAGIGAPVYDFISVSDQHHITESVVKSFCKSQFPHKSVNLSFTIAKIKNELNKDKE